MMEDHPINIERKQCKLDCPQCGAENTITFFVDPSDAKNTFGTKQSHNCWNCHTHFGFHFIYCRVIQKKLYR